MAYFRKASMYLLSRMHILQCFGRIFYRYVTNILFKLYNSIVSLYFCPVDFSMRKTGLLKSANIKGLILFCFFKPNSRI